MLTDPVFFDPFEGGANTSYPHRIVDPARLPAVGCVVISHRHFDHFDVRTLAALDRNVMVFYPECEDLIELALERLGFTRRRGLRPWAKARAGGLELVATPSHVNWPELGLVIRDGHTTVWSLIDTVTDSGVVKDVREQIGRVDCLLAQYSPIVQEELRNPFTRKALDVSEYQRQLSLVQLADPSLVVPSAGGLRFTTASWQNHYGFPVTPDRFIADLADAKTTVQALILNPGDSCQREGGTWARAEQSASFVRTADFDGYRLWQHDPAIGIPAFADTNPLNAPADEATAFAIDYIQRQLVKDLADPANAEALEAWRQWRVTWRLDLYKPHGDPESWWLDSTDDTLELRRGGPVVVDLRTAVTATGIHSVLHGRCSPYGFLFLDMIRHSSRVYSVSPAGVVPGDGEVAEPLLAALEGPRDLDREFVLSELAKWRA